MTIGWHKFSISFVTTYSVIKCQIVKTTFLFFSESDAVLSTDKSSKVKLKPGDKNISLYCSNSVPILKLTKVFS